jgi:cyclase
MKLARLVLLAAMALAFDAQVYGFGKLEFKTTGPSHDIYMLVEPSGRLAVVRKEDLAKFELRTTDLGGDTYLLAGPGGNITFAVGAEAVLLVDSGYAPLHDKVVAAVGAVTPTPIRTIVITHYHEDHTDGIGLFVKNSVHVIAHANVRKRLEEGTPQDKITGFKTEPLSGDALPTETYTDTAKIALEGRRVRAGHPVNAHTDSDTYVYFADANVLCAGDIVTLTRYPFLDVAAGGSIDGLIAAVDTYLRIANDRTKVVPGHGPVVDKLALTDYRERLITARDRIRKLIATGKSVDEAVASKPLADMDAKVGATEANSASFVRRLYRSLQ